MTAPDQDELLDIEAVARIDAVPTILEIVARTTGMRLAAVARVTDRTWTACQVLDHLGFGLQPGGRLTLESTLCNEIRQHGQTIAFGHASKHPVYAGHPIPARYGFEAYISIPIRRPDGRFFGTLCALDPRPLEIDPTVLRNMELLAQLIGLQLETEDRLQRTGLALAESQRIARLREEFIAVLGHDLRSPLQAIVTSAELLGHYGLGARQQQLAELILRSGMRMEEMVRATLDFARGRLGGGIALDLSQHERLAALLEQVVQEAAASHPGRRIETRFELGDPVVCDPYRLSQLLGNLVTNALSHGDADAPVRVEVDRHDGALRLCVRNGGAIPADRVPDLFQPFARREGGARPGLGLGLYIAAEIARAHGGTLEVDTAPERGTCFTFRLPPVAAPSPEAVAVG